MAAPPLVQARWEVCWDPSSRTPSRCSGPPRCTTATFTRPPPPPASLCHRRSQMDCHHQTASLQVCREAASFYNSFLSSASILQMGRHRDPRRSVALTQRRRRSRCCRKARSACSRAGSPARRGSSSPAPSVRRERGGQGQERGERRETGEGSREVGAGDDPITFLVVAPRRLPLRVLCEECLSRRRPCHSGRDHAVHEGGHFHDQDRGRRCLIPPRAPPRVTHVILCQD
jgi:hypothetical protein